jgi:hypothetical protein
MELNRFSLKRGHIFITKKQQIIKNKYTVFVIICSRMKGFRPFLRAFKT